MVGSGRLRQPPLPALGARFTGLEDLGQGKGVNSDLASTQGGALTRLPWATIRSPLRAENSLGVRSSDTPVSSKKDMGHDHPSVRGLGVRGCIRISKNFP